MTSMKQAILDTMTTVKEYTDSNRLQLNASKTSIMLITTNRQQKQDFQIQIDNKVIRHSPQLKILGNLLTDNLSWKDHVTKIVLPGIRNAVRTLRLTTKYLDPKFKGIYTNSTYRSKLHFALETWGGIDKTPMTKVQQVQDQACKLALGNTHPRDSTRKLQARLGWMPISKEVEMVTHLQTWKTLNTKIPEETAALMPMNETGNRMQAQRKLARKPRTLDRNLITRQSYRSRAYKYNVLPAAITGLQSYNKFKKAIKNHLMWG